MYATQQTNNKNQVNQVKGWLNIGYAVSKAQFANIKYIQLPHYFAMQPQQQINWLVNQFGFLQSCITHHKNKGNRNQVIAFSHQMQALKHLANYCAQQGIWQAVGINPPAL